MVQAAAMPSRLYKFKKFDQQTLELLVLDQLYFAAPTDFNDPFDTRPSLEVDIDEGKLEIILRDLVQQRVSAEMSAAAKTIRYRGEKTKDHILRLSKLKADQIIENINYDATDPDFGVPEPRRFLLGRCLEHELLKRYDKGIVSLSRSANCPLMWSHYADQHKGICIGYSVPSTRHVSLRAVEYGGSRVVAASDVAAMLDGNQAARERVDAAVLLRKARPWRYEREWRMIGDRGAQDTGLELEEISFGIRCNTIVRYAVVRALEGRDRAVKYYEMCETEGTFELSKRRLDIDQELALWPRRSIPLEEVFEEIDLSEIGSRPALRKAGEQDR
jgi:hypothetical protein